MNHQRGVVDEIIARDVTARGKQTKVYDLVVGGVRYGAGFTKPDTTKGDIIEFDWDSNEKGFRTVKGAVSVVGKSNGNGTAAHGNESTGDSSKLVTEDQKHYHYRREEAQRKALQFMTIAQGEKALPTSGKTLDWGKGTEALEAYFTKITDGFLKYVVEEPEWNDDPGPQE